MSGTESVVETVTEVLEEQQGKSPRLVAEAIMDRLNSLSVPAEQLREALEAICEYTSADGDWRDSLWSSGKLAGRIHLMARRAIEPSQEKPR